MFVYTILLFPKCKYKVFFSRPFLQIHQIEIGFYVCDRCEAFNVPAANSHVFVMFFFIWTNNLGNEWLNGFSLRKQIKTCVEL